MWQLSGTALSRGCGLKMVTGSCCVFHTMVGRDMQWPWKVLHAMEWLFLWVLRLSPDLSLQVTGWKWASGGRGSWERPSDKSRLSAFEDWEVTHSFPGRRWQTWRSSQREVYCEGHGKSHKDLDGTATSESSLWVGGEGRQEIGSHASDSLEICNSRRKEENGRIWEIQDKW